MAIISSCLTVGQARTADLDRAPPLSEIGIPRACPSPETDNSVLIVMNEPQAACGDGGTVRFWYHPDSNDNRTSVKNLSANRMNDDAAVFGSTR
jgi:hypothetical protein